MKLYAWLVGAWAATLWFFTFGVARVLFSVFPRDRAGEVTTALFPTYFGIAIGLGVAATVVLWLRKRPNRKATIAITLQILALAALAAIPLAIQPAMAGHPPGTPEFAKFHGLSMILNLFSLLAVPAASLLAMVSSKE